MAQLINPKGKEGAIVTIQEAALFCKENPDWTYEIL
jgi:hypothetical protein